MDSNWNLDAPKQNLPSDMQEILTTVRALAENYRQDYRSLLALLRMIEAIHQEICDGLFQEALPNNRQGLYSLLRDIELAGGWPYIPRMKLQDFLEKSSKTDTDEGNAAS